MSITHRQSSSDTPRVGFTLTLCGLMFMINPLINVQDVLPDAIGFLLIYLGLSRASDADAYFEDARRRAGFLCLLCTVKHLLALTLLNSASTLTLPYTFASSVLEIVFVIPFFLSLFRGFAYTSMRRGADEVMKKTSDTRFLCVFYVVAQSVLAFVPQLITFIKQEEEIYFKANSTYKIPTALVYNYVLAFTLIAMLILGVIYAVKLIGYFNEVKKAKDYRASLYETSEEVRSGYSSRYAAKTVGAACLLLCACCVCFLDVVIDGTDYVPAPLSLLFGIISVFVFGARGKKYAAPKILIAAVIPSVFETLYQLFTGKTMDALLHANVLLPKHERALAFLRSTASLPLMIAIFVLEGAALFILYRAFASRTQKLCHDALIGNHDRAILRTGLFMALAYILKCASAAAKLIETKLAVNADVSKYIGMRSRMTALTMEQAKADNALLQSFENAENAAFYLSIACAVLVVFAVFSLLALKGETAGMEEE